MLQHRIYRVTVRYACTDAVQVFDVTAWEDVQASDSVKALLRAYDIDAATARRMGDLLG